MGRTRMDAPALAVLAAVVIAGCGAAGSGSTGSGPTATSPGGTGTAAASGARGTETAGRAGGSGSAGTRTGGSHAPTATRTVTRTVTTGGSPSAGSTAGTGGGSAGAGNASPGKGSDCRAADVKLSYLGGQGAAGHGLLGFAMRNTGKVSCHTVGYPGILFMTRSGGALPTHLTRTTHDFFGPAKYAGLTVSPGSSTSFRLAVSHGLRSSKGCVTAAFVQVIVPNDTTPVRVRIPGGVFECHGDVTVTPMQPGTSAYGYH